MEVTRRAWSGVEAGMVGKDHHLPQLFTSHNPQYVPEPRINDSQFHNPRQYPIGFLPTTGIPGHVGAKNRYILEASTNHTPGALRLASVTSYLFLA